MLPMYSAGSSAEKEKMMSRQGYAGSNGYAGSAGAYPRSGGTGGGFSIRPDKYEKYQPRSSRTLTAGRRATLIRVGGVLAVLFFILMIFIPALRPAAVFGSLSLALFSGGEEFNIETVRYYDLANVGGTSRGWEREERILLCAPLRDASPHLPMFFSHLRNLTYPHNLIDLAFLVGDSKDNTLDLLSDLLAELQGTDDPKQTFGEISVLEKDFGQSVEQDVESRHGFAAQASRRKSMAQARNWLLSAALRPTHSWVYWRDVDVETAPFTILEDLMRHNKDIIVPNVWRPLPDWLGGEQPYDLNSWQESETALALADTLDEDAVIVEGYAEYATWRPHLAYLRDPYGDPDMEMEIDGVGGVSILAKAKVFRSGVHFPAFSFEKHAETEGFGKMAKRMQFSVVGLPHYTIWHLYEPSVDDIRRMEEMEEERIERERQEAEKQERMDKIQNQFDDTAASQWEKDKDEIRQISKKEFANKQKAEDLKAAGAAAQEREMRLEKLHVPDPLEEIPEGSAALAIKLKRPMPAAEETEEDVAEDATPAKKAAIKDAEDLDDEVADPTVEKAALKAKANSPAKAKSPAKAGEEATEDVADNPVAKAKSRVKAGEEATEDVADSPVAKAATKAKSKAQAQAAAEVEDDDISPVEEKTAPKAKAKTPAKAPAPAAEDASELDEDVAEAPNAKAAKKAKTPAKAQFRKVPQLVDAEEPATAEEDTEEAGGA